MRALVLQDFDRLAVEERPDPVPGDGEVRLRVVATGICGSDLHGFTGENGRRVPGQVMGHETVARIDALGPGVDASSFPTGSAATFNPVVVPAAEAEAYAGREQHCPDTYVIGVRTDKDASFADYLVLPATNVVPSASFSGTIGLLGPFSTSAAVYCFSRSAWVVDCLSAERVPIRSIWDWLAVVLRWARFD